jgi:hypothetical protein
MQQNFLLPDTFMSNLLLANTELPLFSQIKPEHVGPAIDQVLAEARATVESCLNAADRYLHLEKPNRTDRKCRRPARQGLVTGQPHEFGREQRRTGGSL